MCMEKSCKDRILLDIVYILSKFMILQVAKMNENNGTFHEGTKTWKTGKLTGSQSVL